MAETKPTKVPEWNTGLANNTEPSGAEKITGWTVDDEPPSSFFNWLQNLAGAWLKWFDERIFDGSTEDDLVIHAPDPGTGAGGDLTLRGADSADNTGGDTVVGAGDSVGTNLGGGALTLQTGESTGTGAADIVFQAAPSGSSGTGTNTP